jgi:hypothetical protein
MEDVKIGFIDYLLIFSQVIQKINLIQKKNFIVCHLILFQNLQKLLKMNEGSKNTLKKFRS